MQENSLATTAHVTNNARINWQKLSYAVIGLGILIRVFHFVVNRSLWLDEIYLSSSLLKMNLAQLISSPLDYQQQAPLGLLVLVKTSVMTFGNNEMALRLIPLIFGIISLIAFYKLANQFLSPAGAFISIAIIASAPFLIFHSVEIKQYSSEMLMTIIALLLYTKYGKMQGWNSLLIWGFSGALILWFSYSVIFVLSGIACGLSLYHIVKKNWQSLLYLLVPFSLWMLSFLVIYFAFIHNSQKSEWLTQWFQEHNSYMPVDSFVSMGKWLIYKLYRFLEYPLGLLWLWDDQTFSNFIIRNFMRMPILPMACFILGIAIWFRMEKKSFAALIFPILLTLIASGFKFYPVYERLSVFLAPVIILLIARGMEKLMTYKWIKPFSLLLISLLLASPVATSIVHLNAPQKLGGYKNADYRELFEYVEKNYINGDVVYVYWNLAAQYYVYKQIDNQSFEAIEGKNLRSEATNDIAYLKAFESELGQLKGKKRVWLVYDNTLNFDIGDTESLIWYRSGPYGNQPGQRILNKFKTMGKIEKEHKLRNASAYLINLEKTP
jgi:uncharacterized membrane protein